MAITRAQQAKQMLQDGGMLVSPSKDGKRPGYRSERFQSARQKSMSAPKSTTKSTSFTGGGGGGRDSGKGPIGPVQPPQQIIGGKTFDVTPFNRGERERAQLRQQIMNQTVLGGNRIDRLGNTRRRGIASLISQFNPIPFFLGLINPALGIASRVATSIPGVVDKFKSSDNLMDFLASLRQKEDQTTNRADIKELQARIDAGEFDGLDTMIDEVALTKDRSIPMISERDMSIPIIPRISEGDMSIAIPEKEKIQTPQEQDFTNFENALMASAKTTNPLDYRIGISDKTTKSILDSGFNLDGTEMTPEEKMEYERQKKEMGVTELPTQFAADGGMIGGGIMDAAGRQNYFLGKLVKKATRAVKKIVKSPIGRLGLFAAASAIPFGASKASLFNRFMALDKGQRMLAGAGLLSAAPLLFGQEEEEQPAGFTGSVGGQIDPRAFTDPYGVLYGAFKAEGGSMKNEPVAKRTMPLLDMGGQEMDLRAEGGFVPIGRMEKADDVPARLSKNEFVFTADAVRNAGDGDVDKGAEVMYNMMKNLEAGGDVSEESQGLEGARNMFQTSKRLEEVL